MSLNRKALLVTISTAASMFCVAAWASAPNPNPTSTINPTPNSVPTPIATAISYDCRFEGGSSGKSGGWFKHCHAEGEFPNPVPTLHPTGPNSTMKLICDDGDDDTDHTVYNDGAKTRLDQNDQTLTIRGLHSVAPFPPIITVANIDADDFCPEPPKNQPRRFSSQLEFVQDGNDYIIPGSCKFACETPGLR